MGIERSGQSLRQVIDRQGFLALGYGRRTWDEMLRSLRAVRPNGAHGRKVYLYVEDVERYLADRTMAPERRSA